MFALIARQGLIVERFGILVHGSANFFLNRGEGLAGDVLAACVAHADRLASLGVGSDARIVEALVGFFFGPIAFTLTFSQAVTVPLTFAFTLSLARLVAGAVAFFAARAH